jgi:hypothetical protein
MTPLLETSATAAKDQRMNSTAALPATLSDISTARLPVAYEAAAKAISESSQSMNAKAALTERQLLRAMPSSQRTTRCVSWPSGSRHALKGVAANF